MTRGFVLGKFMPPHAGHMFLCDFARAACDELTILVCSLPNEPLNGALRYEWMRELFPTCRVIWHPEPAAQAPGDDPEHFWDIWRAIVKRHHPEPIDLVFASEPYGAQLAEEVGARFMPCDLAQTSVPVSGTAVRADPFGNWRYLASPVRAYYAKRVCVFGPESSGKTTLANALAARLDTIVAPEYGRTYTEAFGVELNPAQLQEIVAGHRAGVKAALRQANRVLVEDTDPVLTAIWSQMLFGQRDPALDAFSDYADLYVLCGIDIPWADDGARYVAADADRQRFFDLCETELKTRGLPYVLLTGDVEARVSAALKAIESTIASR